LECLVSPKWMAEANCRSSDPDLFYPTATGRWSEKQVRIAMRVCRECRVRIECLTWAFEIDDRHGILGGTRPEERIEIMQTSRKAA